MRIMSRRCARAGLPLAQEAARSGSALAARSGSARSGSAPERASPQLRRRRAQGPLYPYIYIYVIYIYIYIYIYYIYYIHIYIYIIYTHIYIYIHIYVEPLRTAARRACNSAGELRTSRAWKDDSALIPHLTVGAELAGATKLLAPMQPMKGDSECPVYNTHR